MANVIKLKRSAATATPARLEIGEPAYSEQSGNFFIGTGSGVQIIGGKADHDKLAGIEAGAQVNRAIASQAQAEAGSDNTTVMTPLRVAQAIALYSAGIPNDFNHTGAPDATYDANAGWAAGSVIIDTSATPPEAYRCADPTNGAAVWLQTTLTTDELATVAVIGDTDDITEGTTNLFLTSAERTKLGFVSVTQAVDLDQMETDIAVNNAKVSNVTTDLGVSQTGSSVTVTSSDGTDATIPAADGTNAGVLSSTLYNNIIANNAKVSNIPTDLSVGTVTATEVPILSSDGADIATLPAAGAGLAGILTAGAQRIAGTKTTDNLVGATGAETIDNYVLDGGTF